MKIIHQLHTKVSPFANPARNWVETACEPGRIIKGDRRGKYTLGDAIKQLEYSPQSVLCNECFHEQVGNLRFSNVPTYAEDLADLLNHGQEIIDVEEI